MSKRTAFTRAREDRRLRTFMAGFVNGFASWSLLGDGTFAPRRYQSDGRRGDMKRIGGDMRTALDSFGNLPEIRAISRR